MLCGKETLIIGIYISSPVYTITVAFRYFQWTKFYAEGKGGVDEFATTTLGME